MAIHASFADWYRSAAVTVPEGLLQKRWAGIESVVKKPNSRFVVELGKFFTVGNPVEASVPEGFRQAFRDRDDTFSLRDNFQELRVLAGAALRQLIEGEGRYAMLASLSIVCGSFGPRARALPEREHLDIAEGYLTKQASLARETDTPTSIASSSMTKKRITELLPDSLFAQNSIAAMQEQFQSAFAELVTALSQTQKAVEAVSRTVRVREEELNFLWWLQNAFSTQVGRTFQQVGHATGTLLFPMELADLTTFVPGPPAVTALLVHALDLAGAPTAAESATLADAVNATPRDWRERVSANTDLTKVDLLCPVLFAVVKSLATDGAAEWLPVYRKLCDIPLDHRFTLVELAKQTYRERMLLTAFAEEDK